MSNRRLLYVVDEADGTLYCCWFPPCLDEAVAAAKGWRTKRVMQKRFPKENLKNKAIKLKTPVLNSPKSAVKKDSNAPVSDGATE